MNGDDGNDEDGNEGDASDPPWDKQAWGHEMRKTRREDESRNERDKQAKNAPPSSSKKRGERR